MTPYKEFLSWISISGTFFLISYLVFPPALVDHRNPLTLAKLNTYHFFFFWWKAKEISNPFDLSLPCKQLSMWSITQESTFWPAFLLSFRHVLTRKNTHMHIHIQTHTSWELWVQLYLGVTEDYILGNSPCALRKVGESWQCLWFWWTGCVPWITRLCRWLLQIRRSRCLRW